MAISITPAEVKRKAGVDSANTSSDSAIADLISEMQPALEYSIAEQHLSDTANAGLQATLKLGMLEIITGEFIEQSRRQTGAAEQFSVAGLTIGPSAVHGVELIQQGATRLAPYLKSTLPMMSEGCSSSTSVDADMAFAGKEGW